MAKRICLLLLGIWLNFSVSAGQEISLKNAWEAITNQQYSQASEILESWVKINPDDFETRYLLARVYAWDRQTDKAIEILDPLINRFPANTDYLLSKATFLSWQNQFQQAIELLTLARSITPGYQDIWKLELKLRNQQLSPESLLSYSKIANQYEYQFGDNSFDTPVILNEKSRSVDALGFVYGQDHLDNDTENWHETFVNYSRDNDRRFFSIQAEFYNRFGITDQALTMEYLQKNYLNYQLTGFASFSLENRLLPAWSAAAQANRQINTTGNAELFYKHNQYKALGTDIVRVAFSHLWKNFEPKLHIITTYFNNQQFSWGTLFQTTYFYTDDSLLRLSISENTEVEYSITEQMPYLVRTLSLDGKTKLSKHWHVNLALTYQMQGKAYNKNGIRTGLLYKF